MFVGLAGDDLIKRYPLIRESIGAPGQIRAPNAVALVSGDPTKLRGIVLEAVGPVFERSRVMATQVFHRPICGNSPFGKT